MSIKSTVDEDTWGELKVLASGTPHNVSDMPTVVIQEYLSGRHVFPADLYHPGQSIAENEDWENCSPGNSAVFRI